MHFPHPYVLVESIYILGVLGGIFHFYSNKKLLQANSGEPDQTPCSAASDLVLHCLPISHRKNARLIWVKYLF